MLIILPLFQNSTKSIMFADEFSNANIRLIHKPSQRSATSFVRIWLFFYININIAVIEIMA